MSNGEANGFGAWINRLFQEIDALRRADQEQRDAINGLKVQVAVIGASVGFATGIIGAALVRVLSGLVAP